MLRLAAQQPGGADQAAIDDLIVWMVLGIVLGGRLGYVLFYKPAYYLANPLEVAFVWQGGMAFHGGLLGVMAATVLFSRRRNLALFELADLIACAAPIGLFFGRLANFINGELWGRTTDVAWAVVFPNGGTEPRPPKPDLRGAARRRRPLPAVAGALASDRPAPPARRIERRVLLRLRGGAGVRRAVPRARRPSRFPVGRGDHGPACCLCR